MSLVAYGASDDSETSDVESENPQASTDRDYADGKISDDDDDYVPTAKIQTPISGPSSAVSSAREGGINSVYTPPSTLRDLPVPKPRSLTVEGGGQGEDELEEEVKPKAAQLADAPRKAKQPARIVLPALKKDSDDEEEESQKKSKQPTAAAGASGSRSGLFALLPPPMHTSRKQTNRPLIPYTSIHTITHTHTHTHIHTHTTPIHTHTHTRGKRKWGGSEDIQIIDANVDDYLDPSELMKGISEESAYQPHRKKDNLPSSQQRRKKQITYLAFQAKERELELKNQWSQNRMTKSQSRSKYGF